MHLMEENNQIQTNIMSPRGHDSFRREQQNTWKWLMLKQLVIFLTPTVIYLYTCVLHYIEV